MPRLLDMWENANTDSNRCDRISEIRHPAMVKTSHHASKWSTTADLFCYSHGADGLITFSWLCACVFRSLLSLTGSECRKGAMTFEPLQRSLIQLCSACSRHHPIEWLKERLDNDAELNALQWRTNWRGEWNLRSPTRSDGAVSKTQICVFVAFGLLLPAWFCSLKNVHNLSNFMNE